MNIGCKTVCLSLVMVLAACNRADPPSEQIERAAEEIVTASTASAPPQRSAGPYAPRDECSEVAGAGAFMANLRGAVSARDTDALVALAAEDVKLDFGSGSGIAELREKLDSPDSGLWSELDAIMTLGCASDGGARLTLPWYFAQDIGGDPFSSYLITGERVPLYEGPDPASPVLANISWDIVAEPREYDRTNGFRKVTWTERKPQADEPHTGYVGEGSLRSLLDYRMTVTSRNGRWRIVSLLKGD